jgi:hypothetical protein
MPTIDQLAQLGTLLQKAISSGEFEDVAENAFQHNKWFTAASQDTQTVTKKRVLMV